MTIVADRGAPVALASTVNCTAPSPVPDAPAVTTIHGAELTAVQGQSGPAVTVTAPAPPAAGIGCEVGVMATVQPDSWVIVAATPPIWTAPLRAGPVLDAIARSTAPLPLPDEGGLVVIHEAFDVAVQAHPAAVVTSMRAVLAAAGAVSVAGASEYVHPLG
jgi:hypothetical protein